MAEYLRHTVGSGMNTQVQHGYQRTREMTLDDMLLDNRIVFLIGEITYGRAAEVIMKLLYLDMDILSHLISVIIQT